MRVWLTIRSIVHPKVFLVGMLAMINLRHEWRLTGKTPSQYQVSYILLAHLSLLSYRPDPM